MKPMLAGSLVLVLALTQGASGQQTSAAAPAAAADSSAAATYKLAEGTDVELQFAQNLSSSTSFEGDPVVLTLVKDLKVGNVVVAKAGSKAYGEVSKAQKSGRLGRAGQLEVRVEYLKVGDLKIKLRETEQNEGEGGIKGALISPIARVKHGKNVEISVGDPLHAYVASDTLLPAVGQVGQQ